MKLQDKRNQGEYLLWELITQYSLSGLEREEDIDQDLIASPLTTTMRTLGIDQERVRHIIGTVSETAVQARHLLLGARSGTPVTIHLFCQRKTLAGAIRPKNSHLFGAPIPAGSQQEFLDLNITLETTGERNSGGWGYFIIQRGADLSIAYQESPCVLELYLYKEVE